MCTIKTSDIIWTIHKLQRSTKTWLQLIFKQENHKKTSGLLAVILQKQLMVLGMYIINCKPHLTLINEALVKTQYINKKDKIDLLKDACKNVCGKQIQRHLYCMMIMIK